MPGADGRPPNIVYLHSHDTGRYVQPYGHYVLTPNIQLLADQGVLFRQAFCAAPSCSGSRAAFATGQYPHSNGMIGLAHRGFRLDDVNHHILHTLREGAGYHSELIGEQHIAEEPDEIGYDVVHKISSTHVEQVAPFAVDVLRRGLPEPFFISVGFFETHRSFFEPNSVRDTLYSLPPGNLPDLPEVREDMAAFKASVRSLDQGVGAVLMALMAGGLADRTLVVCTTDHGLAFPGAKATLTDRGTGVLLILRGPHGFTGGRVVNGLVSQIDIFPTLCELAGVQPPDFAQGVSLMPLVRGEQRSVRDAVFTELTYHAAYEPQRAVRTDRFKYVRRFDEEHRGAVLANVDDSPTKDVLASLGWFDRPTEAEELFDLVTDPHEMRNVAHEPESAPVRVELRRRLDEWMRATGDPLLHGPVPAPPGAEITPRTAWSGDETVIADGTGVPA
jgi:N-sulfoglucosamine sulfohydrolase